MADEKLAIDRLMEELDCDPVDFKDYESLLQRVAEECARICDGTSRTAGRGDCARAIREAFRLGKRSAWEGRRDLLAARNADPVS